MGQTAERLLELLEQYGGDENRFCVRIGSWSISTPSPI